MVINCAKFDACSSSNFRGVTTDRQTDRIALFSIVFEVRQSRLANDSAKKEISLWRNARGKSSKRPNRNAAIIEKV